jgi:hypothetical protein
MVETQRVNLFDRMRPTYQKWAEPVTRVFARTVLERADLSPGAQELGHLPCKPPRMDCR